MGLAWNIISGYAGQISFGHQAFFGIGAYVTVLLAAKLGLTPWLGMLVRRGRRRARRRAHRHAHLPAGRHLLRAGHARLPADLPDRDGLPRLPGGGHPDGARSARRSSCSSPSRAPSTCWPSAILAATLVLSRLIETSRLGYSLRAIKENEQAAEAMGVDSFRCKMTAYMLSAAPAAVVGAVYAHAILFVVTPDAVFGVLVIVQTLTVCLVGGRGHPVGTAHRRRHHDSRERDPRHHRRRPPAGHPGRRLRRRPHGWSCCSRPRASTGACASSCARGAARRRAARPPVDAADRGGAPAASPVGDGAPRRARRVEGVPRVCRRCPT